MNDEVRAELERVWEEALVATLYDESIEILAAAREKWRNEGIEAMRDAMKQTVVEFYPTDIFPEPLKGEHGQTVDQCSAAAMRVVVPGLVDLCAARLLEKE